MESQEPLGIPKGGFSFDFVARNALLEKQGLSPPIARKTGTTIAGCIFNGGVVLGADTRATEGPIVCDKNCEKIHYIASNIYCCGAGTSADTENTTGLVRYAHFLFVSALSAVFYSYKTYIFYFMINRFSWIEVVCFS